MLNWVPAHSLHPFKRPESACHLHDVVGGNDCTAAGLMDLKAVLVHDEGQASGAGIRFACAIAENVDAGREDRLVECERLVLGFAPIAWCESWRPVVIVTAVFYPDHNDHIITNHIWIAW
jgi:hypothetical protein